jgi:hypothetical protein
VVLKRVDEAYALVHKLPWFGNAYMYLTLVCSAVTGSFRTLHNIACAIAVDQGLHTMVLASMPSTIFLYQKFQYAPLKNPRAPRVRPVSIMSMPMQQRRSERRPRPY